MVVLESCWGLSHTPRRQNTVCREASWPGETFKKMVKGLLRLILPWDEISSNEIMKFLLCTDYRVLRYVIWKKTQTGTDNFLLLLTWCRRKRELMREIQNRNEWTRERHDGRKTRSMCIPHPACKTEGIRWNQEGIHIYRLERKRMKKRHLRIWIYSPVQECVEAGRRYYSKAT